MLMINESSILIDHHAEDCYQVINQLAERLYQQGFVTAEYGKLSCLREEVHPTGLPTQPFCIAFPHADSEGVIKSALAIAVLKQPIKFRNMADPDEDLDVFLVIMLANADPNEQVRVLRDLATLFGEGEKLAELRAQTSSQSIVTWLKHELKLDLT